ncbi:MAG: LytTR family transcriptional regulator DNA-binding domain-containing protein [Hyphomonadaceae bacterium]|nr:LytTR family transcriptional regulator DNA-binding domain-containing protein [Hyphomonadaceae bacterium]
MGISHEGWIVALSIVVAIQGAYAGLSLTLGLPKGVGPRRRLLLAAAAITLGVAIWSMHFLGMLAIQSPVPIEFLVLPTLISFLVCVIVVGFAIFLASSAPTSVVVLAMSATVMGTGIVVMHFIGMAALHSNALMHHYPAYVVASFLIGVVASGIAFRFAFSGTNRLPLVASSIALGLAISGMHYTAMAGMTLNPATCGGGLSGVAPCNIAVIGTAMSRELLAYIVAIVAFGCSLSFLLTLVPDGAPTPETHSIVSRPLLAVGSNPELLGEAGILAGDPDQVAGPGEHRRSSVLPVEKEGVTHYLPIWRVKAVKAEAHYTSVFDGTNTFFCGLSIADVENRLDQSQFIRVHRSHIVALDHIASLSRDGDSAVARLDTSIPYSLPVSRRKLSVLKAILDGR